MTRGDVEERRPGSVGEVLPSHYPILSSRCSLLRGERGERWAILA